MTPLHRSPIAILLEVFDPLLSWDATHGQRAYDQGWGLFTTLDADHSPIELQRDDGMGIFDSDEQAWRFVVRNAQAGDLACATALHVLAVESPAEHAAIIAHVTERLSAAA